MKMPGFTAEAALGKSVGCYMLVPTLATGAFSRTLIPQLSLGKLGWLGINEKGCIPGCVCIREEGCPCC